MLPAPGADRDRLGRARLLLRVLVEADAAYRARVRVEDEDTFTLQTRAAILDELGRYLQAAEDGQPLPSTLAVIAGPWTAGEAMPPVRFAATDDVVAWLEAVVVADDPDAPLALVTQDWGYASPADPVEPAPSDPRFTLTFSTPVVTIQDAAPFRHDECEAAYAALGEAAMVGGEGEEDFADDPGTAPDDPLARLSRQPGRTVGLEQTLTRAPVYAPSSVFRDLQLDLGLWRTTGSLYGHPFRVLEPRGPLTVRDALGLAHIVRRWADEGCPEDRRVRCSENEAVAWFGYSGTGAIPRRAIRDAMGRLRATTFQSVSRVEGGRSDVLTWGLIDYSRTPRTGPEGRVLVTLSEPLTYLYRAGLITYLDAPTFAALVAEDELAARLWVFLEGERLPWRWSLYSAPEGQPPAEREVPAIADLLRISGWKRRRDVARRVAEAVRVIAAYDTRYRLSVRRAPKGRGMWTLYGEARTPGIPGRATPPALPPGGGVAPDAGGGRAGRAGGVEPDAQSRSESTPTVVSLPSATTNGIPKPPVRNKPGTKYQTSQARARGGIQTDSTSSTSSTSSGVAGEAEGVEDVEGVALPAGAPAHARGQRLSWDAEGIVMEAWAERYPRPPTPRQLGLMEGLIAKGDADAAGIARGLRQAPADADALAHVLGRVNADASSRSAEAKRRPTPRRDTAEDAAARRLLEAVPSSPEPRPRAVPPTSQAEDAALVQGRRRASALAMLRAGLGGDMAERLRAEHGITDAELREG